MNRPLGVDPEHFVEAEKFARAEMQTAWADFASHRRDCEYCQRRPALCEKGERLHYVHSDAVKRHMLAERDLKEHNADWNPRLLPSQATVRAFSESIGSEGHLRLSIPRTWRWPLGIVLVAGFCYLLARL